MKKSVIGFAFGGSSLQMLEIDIDLERVFEPAEYLAAKSIGLGLQQRRQLIHPAVVNLAELTRRIMFRFQIDRPMVEGIADTATPHHVGSRRDDELMPGIRLAKKSGQLFGPGLGTAAQAVLPPRIVDIEERRPRIDQLERRRRRIRGTQQYDLQGSVEIASPIAQLARRFRLSRSRRAANDDCAFREPALHVAEVCRRNEVIETGRARQETAIFADRRQEVFACPYPRRGTAGPPPRLASQLFDQFILARLRHVEDVRHFFANGGRQKLRRQLAPDCHPAFWRELERVAQAGRKTGLVAGLLEAFDEQISRDAFRIGARDQKIARRRIVEMMQRLAASIGFVGTMFEQLGEIFDRPGLASRKFHLDDELVAPRHRRTRLHSSRHELCQIGFEIFIVGGFEDKAVGRLGDE
nr:hypothetical protein [Sphingopyxis sp.]